MIIVRNGARASQSSKVIANRSATATKSARSDSVVTEDVVGDREVDAHEELAVGAVEELLALHDVAAVVDQEAGDGVHDARLVGAVEHEDEVAGRAAGVGGGGAHQSPSSFLRRTTNSSIS